MKIIDKISELQNQQRPFYSFEYFPPKTEAGLHNLYARLDRMAGLEPAFIDVTWGAGGTTSDTSLELSERAQKYFGLDVMMHLTCTDMTRDQVAEVLQRVRDAGIRNIMALRGDPPEGTDNWEKPEDGFSYAADLIKFIREHHGDYFGIAVGGYPEGHLEAPDKDTCIQHLKHKVDAGADFIVTQLFYDVNEFFDYEKRCRAAGINCPIIPGIMPIQTFQRFQRFTKFCGIKVPETVQAALEPIKNDDQQVQAYGVELCVDMAKQLLDHGAPGLHFYTLNLETSVNRILDKLNLSDDCRAQRALPWRPSTLPGRRDAEDVRPIFWSNRPKSYLARTQGWDDFPNGRWGDSRSPTFGNLGDYYLLRRSPTQDTERDRRLGQWGHPSTIEEVGEVFAQFCEGKISLLPWCEVEVQSETDRIAQHLAALNRRGILTINSQPQVNGVPSNDPEVGWGGPGGYVYQKAYVEFFASPQVVQAISKVAESDDSLSFHAVNKAGKSVGNISDVNAVTWGVFPGQEIKQPTIVDPESFMIWKDEAFQLWLDEWRRLYDADSPSAKVIDEINSTWFLVNLVENDFVNGDIFRIFDQL